MTTTQSFGKTIGEIDEIAKSIFSVAEEHGAAKQEINVNLEEATQGRLSCLRHHKRNYIGF